MKQSSEVEGALVGYLEAIGKGEVATIEKILSGESGLRVIGTDPREWWYGHDEIVRLFKAQLEELGGFSVKVEDTEGYEEGSTGWGAAKFTVNVGGNRIDARISTVFHRESGEWKVVQSHASIGAANEEELGKGTHYGIAMPAYVVAQMTVHDVDMNYDYASKIAPTIAGFGGRLLAANDADIREGVLSYLRTVIAEFPSIEAARAWYESAGYQAIVGLRQNATEGALFFVEGLTMPPRRKDPSR